jgi:hypothetical protein
VFLSFFPVAALDLFQIFNAAVVFVNPSGNGFAVIEFYRYDAAVVERIDAAESIKTFDAVQPADSSGNAADSNDFAGFLHVSCKVNFLPQNGMKIPL